jgi:sugar lactone lactonase YvrE
MTSGAHGTVTIERVGDGTDVLGESAVWCTREAALYWVDIREPAIRRWDSSGGGTQSWLMPELIGSIALRDEGGLLVALQTSLSFFDPSSGRLEQVAAPPAGPAEMRFNDGRCDRQGRFWVGTMNNVTRAPEGALYRFDRRHVLTTMTEGFSIPNSLAWSPDGTTMYLADSLQHAISSYDFAPETGAIGVQRPFARTQAPAIPDGSTVDADGCLWNAEYDGWRIVRYAPGGTIDRVVDLPVQRPTSCAFGGANLDVLYITTASQRLTDEERARQPLAGAVLALDVGVRGLPEPRYTG